MAHNPHRETPIERIYREVTSRNMPLAIRRVPVAQAQGRAHLTESATTRQAISSVHPFTREVSRRWMFLEEVQICAGRLRLPAAHRRLSGAASSSRSTIALCATSIFAGE
jgi:hypothetical protein